MSILSLSLSHSPSVRTYREVLHSYIYIYSVYVRVLYIYETVPANVFSICVPLCGGRRVLFGPEPPPSLAPLLQRARREHKSAVFSFNALRRRVVIFIIKADRARPTPAQSPLCVGEERAD